MSWTFDAPFSCGDTTLHMQMTLTPELGARIRACKDRIKESESERLELTIQATDVLSYSACPDLLEQATLLIEFDGSKMIDSAASEVRMEINKSTANRYGLSTHSAHADSRTLSAPNAIVFSHWPRLRALVVAQSLTDEDCYVTANVAGRRNNLDAGRILLETGCLARARAHCKAFPEYYSSGLPYGPFWAAIERELALNASQETSPSQFALPHSPSRRRL